MRRFAILTMLLAGVYFAMRKLVQMGGTPAMSERCSEMCERMLNQMPESFPPDRIMTDLASLRKQTARILDLLESQTGD